MDHLTSFLLVTRGFMMETNEIDPWPKSDLRRNTLKNFYFLIKSMQI